MNDGTLDRRQFLSRAAVLGATAAGAIAATSFVTACSKKEAGLSCTDTNGLTMQQIQTRTSLQYVDATANPEQTCSNCNLFTSAGESSCGSCTVVPGPVHPNGYCVSWVAAS